MINLKLSHAGFQLPIRGRVFFRVVLSMGAIFKGANAHLEVGNLLGEFLNTDGTMLLARFAAGGYHDALVNRQGGFHYGTNGCPFQPERVDRVGRIGRIGVRWGLLVEQLRASNRRVAVAGAYGKQLGGKGIKSHATHS